AAHLAAQFKILRKVALFGSVIHVLHQFSRLLPAQHVFESRDLCHRAVLSFIGFGLCLCISKNFAHEDLGHWTLDIGLWTLDFGHWTLDIGLWTLDFGHWTLNSFDNAGRAHQFAFDL